MNVGEIDEPSTAGASLVKTKDTPVLGGTRGISILREFSEEYLSELPPRVRVRLNAMLALMPQRTTVATKTF